MLTSNAKIFDVNEMEYAYAAEDFRPVCADNTIGVFVPKIMGDIQKTGTDTININGLFDNDSSCKPAFETKVTLTDVLQVLIKENCNWLDKLTDEGMVPKDSMFNVEFVNCNILEPYATTK